MNADLCSTPTALTAAAVHHAIRLAQRPLALRFLHRLRDVEMGEPTTVLHRILPGLPDPTAQAAGTDIEARMALLSQALGSSRWRRDGGLDPNEWLIAALSGDGFHPSLIGAALEAGADPSTRHPQWDRPCFQVALRRGDVMQNPACWDRPDVSWAGEWSEGLPLLLSLVDPLPGAPASDLVRWTSLHWLAEHPSHDAFDWWAATPRGTPAVEVRDGLQIFLDTQPPSGALLRELSQFCRLLKAAEGERDLDDVLESETRQTTRRRL